MKKILFILLSLTLITSCDNEPIDPELTGETGGNNGGGNNGNTSEEFLALSSYSYNTNTNVPFFGEIVVDIDYTFNSDNLLDGFITDSPVFGQEIITNTTVTRDANNNIIETNTYYQGSLSDVTTITYNGSGQITQIAYNDIESDDEDYEFNYTYSGSEITKTEVGSDIVTVYTFNGNGRLVKKESFINNSSIQLEILNYDSNGNVVSSVMSGEINTTSSYIYDSNDNPLLEPFQARDQYSIIGDYYDDQAGNSIAHFSGSNNWTGVISDSSEYNFTITYDNDNRILTRNGSFGDAEVQISQDEIFTYVN
tara:strand:- start:97 stop:1026 length:930 start_codon:yes stop_codon:yes gene_type:complete